VALVLPQPGKNVRSAPRNTTRSSFSHRQAIAQYAGSLAAGEHESYVVRAKRNDLLEIRLEGFAGRAVVAHVFDAATRTPLDTRSREGTRVWAGRVPAEGDYWIDVVRTIPSGDAVLIYRLTVSLR